MHSNIIRGFPRVVTTAAEIGEIAFSALLLDLVRLGDCPA
jgi:hypothetical protein